MWVCCDQWYVSLLVLAPLAFSDKSLKSGVFCAANVHLIFEDHSGWAWSEDFSLITDSQSP